MGIGRPLRHHLFLARAFVRFKRRRLHLAFDPSAKARSSAVRIGREDRRRHADLQRGAVARLWRDAGDVGRRRTHRPRLDVRLLLALRHDRRQRLDRRRARFRRDARASAERADLLSPPPQKLEPQSRQHRRLCHPLGRTLSADAGARRRQPHVGRDDRSARRGDGGGPGRRHHPEPAAHRQPQHDVRPPAAICRPHRRPHHCRGTDRLDGARRQLLGP